MATHETIEWETPVPKKGIFSSSTTPSTPTPTCVKEAQSEDSATFKRTFSERYLSRWAAFMGWSRKRLLCSLAALILLLVLILGLALGIGLSHKSLVTLDTFHPGVLP